MDPNPYESPRAPQPPKKSEVVRKSVGIGVILLLTPIAVMIAFGGSCAATYAFLNIDVFGDNYGMIFLVAWSIFLIPPAVVFAGMMWWAFHDRPRKRDELKKPPAGS